MRQGEDVDGLDLLVVRVVELLGDIDRGDVAGDGGFDVRVLQRHGHRGGLPRRLGEEQAGGRAIAFVGQTGDLLGALILRRQFDDDPDFVGDRGAVHVQRRSGPMAFPCGLTFSQANAQAFRSTSADAAMGEDGYPCMEL